MILEILNILIWFFVVSMAIWFVIDEIKYNLRLMRNNSELKQNLSRLNLINEANKDAAEMLCDSLKFKDDEYSRDTLDALFEQRVGASLKIWPPSFWTTEGRIERERKEHKILFAISIAGNK